MNRIVTTRRHSLRYLSKEDKSNNGIKHNVIVWKCIKCNGFYYET